VSDLSFLFFILLKLILWYSISFHSLPLWFKNNHLCYNLCALVCSVYALHSGITSVITGAVLDSLAAAEFYPAKYLPKKLRRKPAAIFLSRQIFFLRHGPPTLPGRVLVVAPSPHIGAKNGTHIIDHARLHHVTANMA